MTIQRPEPQTMQLSDGWDELSRLVELVAQGERRILVEKAGTPVVALIAARELARLEQFERTWDAGTQALERFSTAFADVPTEEAEAEVARIIADIRRQDAEQKDRVRQSA